MGFLAVSKCRRSDDALPFNWYREIPCGFTYILFVLWSGSLLDFFFPFPGQALLGALDLPIFVPPALQSRQVLFLPRVDERL